MKTPVIEVNFFNNGVCSVRLSVITLCCVCVTKRFFLDKCEKKGKTLQGKIEFFLERRAFFCIFVRWILVERKIIINFKIR